MTMIRMHYWTAGRLNWVCKTHMLLRHMTPEDINAVVAIEQQVQSHPWTRTQFMDSVRQHHCTVAVDEQTHQVMGFCILQPVLDEANLLLMAVAPQAQGRGLGYALLTYAIDGLGEKCTQIFLEVRQSNQAAIALYQKADFHQIDIRKNYYPVTEGGREHAVIMVRSVQDFDFS